MDDALHAASGWLEPRTKRLSQSGGGCGAAPRPISSRAGWEVRREKLGRNRPGED